MLTLVPPPGTGQGTRPRPRHPRPKLTEAENARLKTVLKNLHRAYGTWGCLAETMGVSEDTLHSIVAGRHRGSYAFAVFAARAAGLPVEEVLTGGLTLATNCPLCGAPHKGAQGQAQAKAVE